MRLCSSTQLLAGLLWLTPAQAQVEITNPTAVPDSTSSIRLGFGSVVTFEYQMAAPGGSWGPWTKLPADKIVRGLAPGNTYSFRIRVPAGADSLIVSAATTSAPPPPPPPPPVTCSTATPHVPGGPDGMGGCWPGPNNTGFPIGTTLTAYTGPCSITVANTVIDGKVVNCSLDIRASGVRITNSKVTGSLTTTGGSATVENTEIVVGSPFRRGIIGCELDRQARQHSWRQQRHVVYEELHR